MKIRERCACGAEFEIESAGFTFNREWAEEAMKKWRAEHQCPNGEVPDHTHDNDFASPRTGGVR